MQRFYPLLILLALVLAACGDATPQANPTPTQASATSAPTMAPTATPNRNGPTRSQIDNLIATSAMDVTVTSYSQSTATLVLATNFGYRVVLTQQAVKGALQDAQVAFWQKGWYFSTLTVNAVQSQQSGPDVKVGSCVLNYATASHIDWNNPGDLWSQYNQKSIDSTLP